MFMRNIFDFEIKYGRDKTRVRRVSIGTWTVYDIGIMTAFSILDTDDPEVYDYLYNSFNQIKLSRNKREVLKGQTARINFWYWMTGGNSFWQGIVGDIISVYESEDRSEGYISENEEYVWDEDESLKNAKLLYRDKAMKIVDESRTYGDIYKKIPNLKNEIREEVFSWLSIKKEGF